MATINEETQASNRLSERLRSGLALAQTRIHSMEARAKNQWTDLPVQLRSVVDRAVARLRTSLDLPSRSDVTDLVERLEALDRKIVALEKRQGKRGAAAATDSAADAEEVEPATAQRAGAAEPEAHAKDAGDGAKAGASTARKTVKATSAGKTVKAGGKAARPAEQRGPGKRKKGHRGQR